MNVGVIGGGAAGLAAAYELIKQGHQATVFERAPFLGGQASTFDVGGARLERGYHHLFVSDVDMVALMSELGLGPRLAWISSKVGLYHGGRIWNFVTPLDLLRFRGIGLLDRLRLGAVTLLLNREKDWRRLEPYTAAGWLPARVGQAAYRAVWEPLLRGKFGERYDQVGMTWFWGKIALRFASRGRGMAKEKLGYPMGSFGEIFDTLGEFIRSKGGRVYTSAAVRRVVVEEGRAVGLEVELPGQGVTVEPFDAVVATVPSYIFPRLVPTLPKTYEEKLAGVTYLAAVLVILELKQPISQIYWLNIADRSIPFVAVIGHTNFVGPEHYGGKHLVYLSNYLGRENPMYFMKHQELLDAYLPHLQKLNPQFSLSWIENSHYHREDAAQPVVGVNYSRQIPEHHTPIRNLYLANTTQVYPEDRGTNYSVRLGRKVARILLKDYGFPVSGELPKPAIPSSVTVQMES
ncbi:MAG: NAD(P)/FAD-dependent oxidoreductase [Chloroflexi bacterium]|nr:NAD(P)/FAD-dependent oxidoreductase [Chloroflexota bacterium]